MDDEGAAVSNIKAEISKLKFQTAALSSSIVPRSLFLLHQVYPAHPCEVDF
jgi:hypothetical protein